MPDLASLATADIMVENHGTVVLLRPMTRAGAIWLLDNVNSEPWQWMGNAVAVAPRYVQPTIDGAEAAGLVVAA